MIGRLAHIGRIPEIQSGNTIGAKKGMRCPVNVVHSPIPGFEERLTSLGLADTPPTMSVARRCLIQGFPSYGLRDKVQSLSRVDAKLLIVS